MAPRSSTANNARLANEILAMMQGMERRMQRSFLNSVSTIVDDPALLALLQDIRDGQFIALTPGVDQRIAQIALNEDELVQVARTAMTAAGRVTTKATGLQMAFDLQNPRVIQAARTLGANLVTNVSATTRATLRMLIGDAIEGEQTLAATKRLIGERVGLLPQHAQAVQRLEDTLTTSGMSKTQVQKRTSAYAKRLLKYRANMIARTEVANATSIGQYEVWQQARDKDLIPPDTQRVWIVSADERLCEICAPMAGELAPLDGFWNTPNGPLQYPKAHPQCRCTSGLVFDSPVRKADPFGLEYWQNRPKHPLRFTWADRPEILKGDYPGHPFRGNQWVQFPGGAPMSTGRQRVSERVDAQVVRLGLDEVEHDDLLKETYEQLDGDMHYLDGGGSYWDDVDEDSDISVNEQMINAFEEHTGIVVDRAVGSPAKTIDDLDPEALCEVLDAMTYMQDEWGTAPSALSFTNAHTGGGTTAWCGAWRDATVGQDWQGNGRTVSGDGYEYYSQINFNPEIMMGAGLIEHRAYHLANLQNSMEGKRLPHLAPTQLTAHQSTLVHEFGHLVHNWAVLNNPAGYWNTAAAIADVSARVMGGRNTVTGGSRFDRAWEKMEFQADWQSRTSIVPKHAFLPDYGPLGRPKHMGGNTYLTRHNPVSNYANTNAAEFWAETFTLVYGNPGGMSTALKSVGNRGDGTSDLYVYKKHEMYTYSPSAAYRAVRQVALEAFEREF